MNWKDDLKRTYEVDENSLDPFGRPRFTHYKSECCDGYQGECQSKKEPKWVRLDTYYQNERSNWAFVCAECQWGMDEAIQEQWREYYYDKL